MQQIYHFNAKNADNIMNSVKFELDSETHELLGGLTKINGGSIILYPIYKI